MKEYKDTVKLVVFTLDIVTQNYFTISSIEGLPYDAFSLLACPAALGGVVILTSNSIIYVDQASRRVPLPLNGWPTRISDMPMPTIPPEHQSRTIELEGSCSSFVDDKTIVIILKDGAVYSVDMVIDGKTVSKLNMGSALARTAVPAVVRRITDSLLFVGSTVGPSVLLKAAHREEEIDDEVGAILTAVVRTNHDMEFSDDEGKSDLVLASHLTIFQISTALL